MPWTITDVSKITGQKPVQTVCCRKPRHSSQVLHDYDSLAKTFLPDLYLVSVVRHLRSVFNFISAFVVENLLQWNIAQIFPKTTMKIFVKKKKENVRIDSWRNWKSISSSTCIFWITYWNIIGILLNILLEKDVSEKWRCVEKYEINRLK